MNSNETLLLMVGPMIFGLGGMIAWSVCLSTYRSSRRKEVDGKGSRIFRVLYRMQWALLTIAWLIYALALFEPAVDMPGVEYSQLGVGWQALVVGFPFWGVNVWFLLSPLLLWWIGAMRNFGLQFIALLVQGACAVAVLYFSTASSHSRSNDEYPGSRHWRVAFFVLLVAYALPSTIESLLSRRRNPTVVRGLAE